MGLLILLIEIVDTCSYLCDYEVQGGVLSGPTKDFVELYEGSCI